MYNELVAWIDEALAQGIPEDAVAVCFNVYEDGEINPILLEFLIYLFLFR